jgi:hypothetical protein
MKSMARRQGIPSARNSSLRGMFLTNAGPRGLIAHTEPEKKADKGKKAGSCNRTACQRPGAVWWNRGSYAFYCGDCAHMLNRANRDFPDGDLCVLDPEALELLATKA